MNAVSTLRTNASDFERVYAELLEAQKLTAQIAQMVVDDTPLEAQTGAEVLVDAELFALLRTCCARQSKACEAMLAQIEATR